MARRMARHIQHTQLQRGRLQRHRIALAHGLGASADTLACRPDHRHRGAIGGARVRREQLRHTALMIAMVMGDYNSAQSQPLVHEELLHRRRLAGIDHGSMTAVVDGPDIVILECGDRLHFQHACAPMADRPIVSWEDWLASPPGQYMLRWEAQQYDRTVTDIFGYHAVQMGLPAIDTLRENRMPFSALALDPASGPHGPRAAHPDARQLLCRFDELPFDTQSIDLATLPHVLEFAEDPHEVLREVSRVLVPEARGNDLLQPDEPVGARQGLNRVGATPFLPTDAQSIGFVRIKDWLKLLGFDIIRGRFGCYCPPYRTDRWLQRAAFMEKAGDRWWPIFGAVYMISAVKRVRNIRLVGPAWKPAKAALTPVAAPWPHQPARTERPRATTTDPAGSHPLNPETARAGCPDIRHMQEVTIYSDGACKGNPGRGGWGAVLVAGTSEKELFGGEANTTNNRMEMTAVIEALRALKRPCIVQVYTDSQYVQKGISEWLPGWKARGWKTADKKPVKNADLWQQLDVLAQQHQVSWHWVRGHNGHPGNERADALANRGVASLA